MSLGAPKKPSEAHCTFVRRLAVADEDARYVGNFARYDVHLGDGHFYLSSRLSIPLGAIRAKEMIERGWLIPRRALRIVFDHPESGVRDVVHLCDIDFLGFYHRPHLDALSKAIDEAVGTEPGLNRLERSAEIPETAKTDGYFVEMFRLFSRLSFSYDTLAVEYYRGSSEESEFKPGDWNTVETARSAFTRDAVRRGIAVASTELPRREYEYVLAQRVLGLWNLLRMFVVPFWILGQWWARSGEAPSLAMFLGLVLGFIFILPLSLYVQPRSPGPSAGCFDDSSGWTSAFTHVDSGSGELEGSVRELQPDC